jgi:hypothetical protein
MKPRFDKSLKVRMPARLAELIEDTAGRQCRTTPEFIRQAVVRALSHQGVKYEPQETHHVA